MTAATLAVFALGYVLIAFRRVPWLPIGRPAGALLGATLMVAIGALSPRESFAAIDGDTLLLLFGTMLLTVYLRHAGFFEHTARWLLRHAGTPFGLLVLVSLLAAALSAALVNDTACVFLTPVVIATCARAGLPLSPYLLALSTSANLGSVATLVGNPQNMIIGSLSGLTFTEFLAVLGPAALVGLASNLGLLTLYYRRRLPRHFPTATPLAGAHRAAGSPGDDARPAPRELWLAVGVTLAVLVGFAAGLHLGYTALGGALALVVLSRREPREALALVDWPLLVFFAGLFVLMGGLGKTGLAQAAFGAAAPHLHLGEPAGVAGFTALMTAGSNLFSNVPMVLLTGPHLGQLGAERLGWALLAYTTTVAGNLTLVGSVANLIVAEGARAHHRLGFVEYLRFGAISTLAALLTGVPVVWLLATWRWGA